MHKLDYLLKDIREDIDILTDESSKIVEKMDILTRWKEPDEGMASIAACLSMLSRGDKIYILRQLDEMCIELYNVFIDESFSKQYPVIEIYTMIQGFKSILIFGMNYNDGIIMEEE